MLRRHGGRGYRVGEGDGLAAVWSHRRFGLFPSLSPFLCLCHTRTYARAHARTHAHTHTHRYFSASTGISWVLCLPIGCHAAQSKDCSRTCRADRARCVRDLTHSLVVFSHTRSCAHTRNTGDSVRVNLGDSPFGAVFYTVSVRACRVRVFICQFVIHARARAHTHTHTHTLIHTYTCMLSSRCRCGTPSRHSYADNSTAPTQTPPTHRHLWTSRAPRRAFHPTLETRLAALPDAARWDQGALQAAVLPAAGMSACPCGAA